MKTRTKPGAETQLERRLRSRIDGGGKAFVPYLTAGLPSPQRFVELLSDLATISDAVEIGIPFSDPIIDGPVIQEASARSLASGMTLPACVELMREVRRHAQVPLVVMTYFNPVHRAGSGKFARLMSEAGVAGVIVPDLPWEESKELAGDLAAAGIALVQLVAPTTPEPRAAKLASASSGFVYAVSRLGVTGEQEALDEASRTVVERIRPHTRLPVLLGIGISSGEQARQAAAAADGVIIGSALVKRVLAGDTQGVVGLAREIRRALEAV